MGLSKLDGWYFDINSEDLDGDGDQDLIVGNIGLNHKFNASLEKPFEVYGNDFDENGTYDIVLAKNYKGGQLPVRGRQCSSDQMPFIKTKFPNYQMFADAKLKDIYGEALEQSLHLEVYNFASVLLINDGGKFKINVLPTMAQLGPINTSVVYDFNKDGKKDILLAGAMHHPERETTRADALISQLLVQGDDGEFVEIPLEETGLYLRGDVKHMAMLSSAEGPILLVANNDAPLEMWKLNDIKI